jgi:hypothetical protein
MAAIDSLRGGATGAVRLGRGLADRAIRATAPTLGKAVSRVVSRVPRRRTPPPAAGGTTTFAPSRPAPPPGHTAEPVERSDTEHPVTPGTVARNIAPQRPTARVPANRRPARKSVPGAKLPPPRPSAS